MTLRAAALAVAPVAALAFTSVADASTISTSRVAHVGYVVDGDTVRLMSGRYVRLIGYDTPEYGHPYFKAAKRSLNRFYSGQRSSAAG
jgi:endonuclease YncB( thermonuclease family)